MRTDAKNCREKWEGEDRCRSHGRRISFALVAIALILAVGFYYLTSEKRRDRPAESVTKAAASVDNAARVVGDAARDAADDMRSRN